MWCADVDDEYAYNKHRMRKKMSNECIVVNTEQASVEHCIAYSACDIPLNRLKVFQLTFYNFKSTACTIDNNTGECMQR